MIAGGFVPRNRAGCQNGHFWGTLYAFMEAFKNVSGDYLRHLAGRAKESKVYSAHQMVGLELSQILHDRFNKALYIRLAKTHPDHQRLLMLAKDIAGRQGVVNRGAYFMRLLFDGGEAHKNNAKKNSFGSK
jgi:hypothetical protein